MNNLREAGTFTDAAKRQTQIINRLVGLLVREKVGVVHVPGASTACIQYHKDESKTIVLPLWKNMPDFVYTLMTFHECAHATDTPGYAAHEQIMKDNKDKPNFAGYLNVTEDARIERIQQERYPGIVEDFHTAYKWLIDGGFFDNDLFGIKVATHVHTMPFVDRFNIFFKCGDKIPQSFEGKEAEFIERGKKLLTFDDALKLAEDMYEYSKDESMTATMNQLMESLTEENGGSGQKQDGQGGNDQSADGDQDGQGKGSGEDGKGSGEDGKGSSEDGSGEDGKGSSEDGSGEDGSGDDSGDGSSQKNQGEGEKGGDQVSLNPWNDRNHKKGSLPCSTDIAWRKKETELVENSTEAANAVGGVNISRKLPIDELIIPNSKVLRDCGDGAKVDTSVNRQIVTSMRSVFIRRAQAYEYARTQEDRRGSVDPRKLHKFKTTDKVFKVKRQVPDGQNHGLVIIVDWSGSMGSNLEETASQVLNLVEFCRMARIDYEVYAFSDAWHGHGGFKTLNTHEGGLYWDDDFRLIEFFTSSQNAKQHEDAVKVFMKIVGRGNVPRQYKLNMTPLAEAFGTVPSLVHRMRSRGVDIVNVCFLTDGWSSSGLLTLRNGFRESALGREVTVLTDEETQKVRTLTGQDNKLMALPKHFADMLGCNMVNFHIVEDYEFEESYNNYGGDPAKCADAKSEFAQYGCSLVETDGRGFTHVYFISPESAKNVSAVDFKKRMLLEKFVTLIAERT